MGSLRWRQVQRPRCSAAGGEGARRSCVGMRTGVLEVMGSIPHRICRASCHCKQKREMLSRTWRMGATRPQSRRCQPGCTHPSVPSTWPRSSGRGAPNGAVGSKDGPRGPLRGASVTHAKYGKGNGHVAPGCFAHPGTRAFWLGGGCAGGRLSEGRPGEGAHQAMLFRLFIIDVHNRRGSQAPHSVCIVCCSQPAPA